MSSPAEMPQRRPVHPFRPPLDARPPRQVPQWHCRSRKYQTETAADEALGRIWSEPGGRRGDGPMEAHAYQCRRHPGQTVWHLTSQDQKGRAS